MASCWCSTVRSEDITLSPLSLSLSLSLSALQVCCRLKEHRDWLDSRRIIYCIYREVGPLTASRPLVDILHLHSQQWWIFPILTYNVKTLKPLKFSYLDCYCNANSRVGCVARSGGGVRLVVTSPRVRGPRGEIGSGHIFASLTNWLSVSWRRDVSTTLDFLMVYANSLLPLIMF